MKIAAGNLSPGDSGAISLDYKELGLRLVIIALVCWALQAFLGDQLAEIRLADIQASLSKIPPAAVLAALGLTAISYVALSFYDPVALRQIGETRPLGEAVRTGFIATTLGQTFGFGLIIGSVARWRLYRRGAMSPAQSMKASLYVALGFYCGLATLVAIAASLAPDLVGRTTGLTAGQAVVAAAAVLGALLDLSIWLQRRRGRAGPGWLATFTALAAADTVPAALALWILLPAHAAPPLTEMLCIYMIALALGQISNTPGGVGLFEAVTVPRNT